MLVKKSIRLFERFVLDVSRDMDVGWNKAQRTSFMEEFKFRFDRLEEFRSFCISISSILRYLMYIYEFYLFKEYVICELNCNLKSW